MAKIVERWLKDVTLGSLMGEFEVTHIAVHNGPTGPTFIARLKSLDKTGK